MSVMSTQEQNTPQLSDERKQELKCAREAQKRLTWINNVKRIYNWDQETAEREWAKIHNSESKHP